MDIPTTNKWGSKNKSENNKNSGRSSTVNIIIFIVIALIMLLIFLSIFLTSNNNQSIDDLNNQYEEINDDLADLSVDVTRSANNAFTGINTFQSTASFADVTYLGSPLYLFKEYVRYGNYVGSDGTTQFYFLVSSGNINISYIGSGTYIITINDMTGIQGIVGCSSGAFSTSIYGQNGSYQVYCEVYGGGANTKNVIVSFWII